jgi:hypothetical protein
MHFRAYLDNAKGGDHARIIDFELDLPARPFPPQSIITTGLLSNVYPEARAAAEKHAKRGEVVGEITIIKPDDGGREGGAVGMG